MKSLTVILEALLSIGSSDADNEALSLKKSSLILVPLIIGPAAFIWGVILIALDHPYSGAIPLSYSLISVFNLWHLHKTKNIIILQQVQLTLVLILPFLLMWSLGGFAFGSFVMIWAFFAPVAALTYAGHEKRYYWFYAFMLLLLFSVLIDQSLIANYSNPLSSNAIELFNFLNISAGLSGLFFLMRHYILEQEKNSLSHLATINKTLELKIEEKIEIETALKSSERRFTRIAHATPIGIFQTDINGNCIFINEGYQAIAKINEEDALGDGWSNYIYPDDRQSVFDEWALSVKEERAFSMDYRQLMQDKSFIWIHCESRSERNNEGEIISYIGTIQDITESKNSSDKLSYQASHDSLTGLINRREFEKRLQALLGQSIDDENHAVLYLDLDQFKTINDTCGHHAGDELLKQLPKIIKLHLRGSDLLARIGGDEFAIILMGCNLHKVKQICQSIINSISKFQFKWDDKVFSIGVSIGIVEITDHSINLHDTLRFADSACYSAKDAGRNQFKIYSDSDQDIKSRTEEMNWLSRINNALDNSLFVLYAQLIIPADSDTNSKPSYELLVRMDLNGKIVPPGAFLPAAERYNQMLAIDRCVISTAFSMIKDKDGFMNSVDHLSINLSTLSLANKEFLHFLVGEISDSNYPEKICLEITETAMISNLQNVKMALTILKGMGVRFSLDDFGSGLSSYSYLKTLDVDYLKVDGYFVKDIVTDEVDRAMVKSMIDVGVALGKKTIAEFVENEKIHALLKGMGVDYVQGYGIEKPVQFKGVIDSVELDLL